MSKIADDWLNPAWHRMLYSCTHMATVGVKGLNKYGGTVECVGHLQHRTSLVTLTMMSC